MTEQIEVTAKNPTDAGKSVAGTENQFATNNTSNEASYIEPPNFAQLESAFKVLDPDCSEYVWNFHRMAPMANTAAAIPEIADRLCQLARDWSSGDLRGVPSTKWVTPGSNGLTGEQYFDRAWNRFYKGNYTGKKATLATIFFHAKQAGWVWNYRDAANDDGRDSV